MNRKTLWLIAAFATLTVVALYNHRGYLIPFVPHSAQAATEIERLKLPPGFTIHLYADDVPGARSMTLSPSGTLYVGTRGEGNVYALQDSNGDFRIDKKFTLLRNGNQPNGVAFHNGDLYIAEINRILRLQNIESALASPPAPIVVREDYPSDHHHGWKFIAIGPDGWLYVPVGAPCNICLSEKSIYASISRINLQNGNREIYAAGVRNSVGFDWHPQTGQLWFTDNGRDWLGDNSPPDELNTITAAGQHFGYPFCHGGDIADPGFGDGKPCKNYTAPSWKFDAHVAALGMRFYTGKQFPKHYQGGIFVAQHGSWNRSEPIGYRVVFVTIKDGKAVDEQTFVDGWLDKNGAWGRPADVLQLPDGSLLISDDKGGRIYRVSYKK